MTQENWWLLEQQRRLRVKGFLDEVERDRLARLAGGSAAPYRGLLANALRDLARRLDSGNRAGEPSLAPAR